MYEKLMTIHRYVMLCVRKMKEKDIRESKSLIPNTYSVRMVKERMLILANNERLFRAKAKQRENGENVAEHCLPKLDSNSGNNNNMKKRFFHIFFYCCCCCRRRNRSKEEYTLNIVN